MDYPTISEYSMNTNRLALLSLLTALCVGIQLTPRPPNVEFTSLVSFAAGAAFGSWAGAFLGGMTMFINGFFSPWGHAGLNMPFQMVGMAVAGILGRVYKRFAPNEFSSARFCLETAILGALIALIYDLITNVGVGIQFISAGVDPALALFSAVAYGSFFSLIHILSNSAVFGFLLLPFTSALNSLKVGGFYWSKKERLSS